MEDRDIKRKAEDRALRAAMILHRTLERHIRDSGKVLAEYEATHDDYELSSSAVYTALVIARLKMSTAVDAIEDNLDANSKTTKIE